MRALLEKLHERSGETLKETTFQAEWRAMDLDRSGDVDLQEFTLWFSRLNEETQRQYVCHVSLFFAATSLLSRPQPPTF